MDEGGVRLELTLIDTPGFGDIVDNTQWYVWVGVANGWGLNG